MKPTIICLTPIRNEAWILDNFLKSASLWADLIIIADQMSTDGSREIALKYPKVKLIDNNSAAFNEPERQKLLINEARKIEGQRLIITLDADEMFSPEIFHSAEWENVLNAAPGTIIKFQWANLLPGFKKMWYGYYFPWGYMDDGTAHNETNKIHSGRIPLPEGHPEIEIRDFKVMHFQYTNWERMESKHRWYQCYEKITFPEKSAVEIYRQYHHMLAIPKESIISVPQEWIDEYKKLQIDISMNYPDFFDWFEEQIVNMIERYGAAPFKKLRIWDINWVEKAKQYEKEHPEKYKDPRSLKDKFIQYWLLKTQNKLDKRNFRRVDHFLQKVLKY